MTSRPMDLTNHSVFTLLKRLAVQWLFPFFLAPSLIADQRNEVLRNVTVSSLLQSNQAFNISEILGSAERLSGATDDPEEREEKLTQLTKLARDVVEQYLDLVTVSIAPTNSIETSTLSRQQQDEIEHFFDEGLIRIFGHNLARKLKALFVKFFYVETGAFGKYALQITVRDKMMFVSVGTLREIRRDPSTEKIMFHHPFLTKLQTEK